MRKAVYPGTFDPVTHGHLDLIRRGAHLFEEVLVLVGRNPRKEPLFTAEERVALIGAEIADLGNVAVEAADGLTVDFVRARGFEVILRGIRTTDDFVHEHRMALTNRELAPEVETVLLVPALTWSYLSSSLIREVALAGGDIGAFVPPRVAEAVRAKVASR